MALVVRTVARLGTALFGRIVGHRDQSHKTGVGLRWGVAVARNETHDRPAAQLVQSTFAAPGAQVPLQSGSHTGRLQSSAEEVPSRLSHAGKGHAVIGAVQVKAVDRGNISIQAVVELMPGMAWKDLVQPEARKSRLQMCSAYRTLILSSAKKTHLLSSGDSSQVWLIVDFNQVTIAIAIAPFNRTEGPSRF